jgi:hypothetical protein
MDNPTHPGCRAIAVLGDQSVGEPASRQQNNAGVAVIHLIDELLFHTMELEPFMGLERPCFNRFDRSFSISILNISTEKLRQLLPKGGRLYQAPIPPRRVTKLSDWKRH